MRYLMIMLLALMPATALLAEGGQGQEPERQERQAPQMTEAGKLLFDDVKRVYGRYYAAILQKARDNEAYKAEDVWNDAVKAATNAEYKDRTEFQRAITDMRASDRVFRREVTALTNKLAQEHAEAVRKIEEDRNR
jgi:hypothetical protein